MEEMVVVSGQPAGWKTMVQFAVWIGNGAAGAIDEAMATGRLEVCMLNDENDDVAVATGRLEFWKLSEGNDDVAATEDA